MQLLYARNRILRIGQNRSRGLLVGVCLLEHGLRCIGFRLDANERLLLGRELCFRFIERDLIVTRIELEDHIACLDLLVGSYRDILDVTGNLWCYGSDVALNISVVGRNHEAPDRPPVIGEPEAAGDRDRQNARKQDTFAEALLLAALGSFLGAASCGLGAVWGCDLSFRGASLVAGWDAEAKFLALGNG